MLERRFSQSFENLAHIIPVCDEIYFFDNSELIEDREKQKFSNLNFIAKKLNNTITLYVTDKIEWFENVIKNSKIDNIKK